MTFRVGICLGLLAASPAWSQAPDASKDGVPARESAQAPTLHATSFSLTDDAVRRIVREAALDLTPDYRVESPKPLQEDVPSAAELGMGPLRMKGSRVPARYECELDKCAAYDRDGNVLWYLPRDQFFTQGAGKDSDVWLSCQQHNDMLSTFERVERCQGMGLLMPTPWDKVRLAVPLLPRP